ncbi:MAG: hypothetical protein LBP80_10315 [Treponema sp.]|nr:hypothetical protein [Treponema sp.]
MEIGLDKNISLKRSSLDTAGKKRASDRSWNRKPNYCYRGTSNIQAGGHRHLA